MSNGNRNLVVMYDLASGEHRAAQDFFETNVPSRWIRAQRSVILAQTPMKAEELVLRFVSFLTVRFEREFTPTNQVLAFEITDSEYCGHLDGDVLRWLERVRAM